MKRSQEGWEEEGKTRGREGRMAGGGGVGCVEESAGQTVANEMRRPIGRAQVCLCGGGERLKVCLVVREGKRV